MDTQFIIANTVFALVYVLLILERIPKVVVALLGGSLLILTGVLTQEEAFQAIDFNVIFLLVGMMILVNILTETGFFDWLTVKVVKLSSGSGVKLLWALCLLTAFCSAFLDNVTTILFIGTITCKLAKKLDINPVPFLISEVMASNIGGTATLIGDPPNIMIGSAAKLTFNDFLFHLAPIVMVILPISIFTLSWIYRKELQFSETTLEKVTQLETQGLITDKLLMQKGLIILGLVMIGFMTHHVFHLEVGTIALFGAACLMLFEKPEDVWNDVEWDSIFFFIGLFMIIGGVEKVGTLSLLGEQFFEWSGGNLEKMTLALLWVSGFASAIIDNIPYTATMIGLIQNLKSHLPEITPEQLSPLWWSLALGACLGGNGSLIGATANVIAADMAANRTKTPIHFWEFTRVGFLIMLLSLTLSTVYIQLRYF
jgi:Na+/H+ antiporter NhaD/arsenite permease-like protein